MENTNLLNLPYIMANQAQKHVTHNEALRALDAVVQLSVLSIGTDAPPVDPDEGDRYVVGATPTGDWQDAAGKIAVFVDGAWMFHSPQTGWLAWHAGNAELAVFSNGKWELAGGSGEVEPGAEIQDIAFLGINSQAGNSERLVVQSSTALLNHDGADHRLKINKNTEADTASLVFQSGFSGRAEFGLAGEDAFSVKVSTDGTNWLNGMRIDPATGEPEFPEAGITVSSELVSNLLPDSGRFNAASQQDNLLASTASAPIYIQPFNGATLSFPFRFIHNNSNYGGVRGALDPVMDELIFKIFGAGGLRYGPEFWCMKVDPGTGTSSPQIIEGETYFRATITSSNPRPARHTTGFFVKCETGKLGLINPYGTVRRLLRNDSPADYDTADVIVTPADGWAYFEMQLTRQSIAYELTDMAVFMLPGSSGYLALPRVASGWVGFGANQAVVTNYRVFGG